MFSMTAAILLPFKALVKNFKPYQRLQKADRMVGLNPIWLTGIIPLWPPRRQADGQPVHRAPQEIRGEKGTGYVSGLTVPFRPAA